ncbi:DNA replication complex GINS protein SLD5 [Diorhabda carinulata]|uniref:DNA replication complex GINS protein SLD5 n=1 Tax=Diorhabda sublineata TaxID=1163346 RepID=UPI0024E0A4B8|nr:DNA replication complex GINS protein SLD5 [Diorhabda sublineata]XP_057661360.1 DNA replication complex GINS protein SLD5 [Diorhabda carinulata]
MTESNEDFSFDIDDVSINSEEQVQITPAEVIELIEEAWINEKFAPEILPHKSEIVEIILDQISNMEENIKNLCSTDFTKIIYQLEVDRLRFLVSSYLRTRLEKIEIHVNHILGEEAKRIDKRSDLYLSHEELKFAKEFSFTMEQYFDKLMRFYPGVPSETWSNQIVEPNNNSFVFLKSKNRVEGVLIDKNATDSDLIDFDTGSQIIISYNSVSDLIKKSDVQLI